MALLRYFDEKIYRNIVPKKYRYFFFSAFIKYFSDLKIFEKDRLWCKHLKILQNPNIFIALTLEYAL